GSGGSLIFIFLFSVLVSPFCFGLILFIDDGLADQFLSGLHSAASISSATGTILALAASAPVTRAIVTMCPLVAGSRAREGGRHRIRTSAMHLPPRPTRAPRRGETVPSCWDMGG